MRLLPAALLALLTIALAPTVLADATLAAHAEPGSLRLVAGGAQDVRVVVDNPGARDVNVELRITETRFPADAPPGAGITVKTGTLDETRATIPPGGSASFHVLVQAKGTSGRGVLGDVVLVAQDRDDASNAATFALPIEVGPVPPAVAASQLATAAGLGAAVVAVGLVASSPAARGALAAPIVALYTRIRRSETLEQETRRRIHAAIEEEPGIGYAALLARTGRGAGVVAHHLRVLEREGLVVSRRVGRSRRLFPAGAPRPASG